MLPIRPRDLRSWLVPLVLLGLLAALATLQYRWIGQVSELERDRMRQGLAASGARLTSDVDRELTRLFLYVHPGRPAELPLDRGHVVRQIDRWRAVAPEPKLLRDVLLVTREAGGGLRLEGLRPGERAFTPRSWTPDLEPVRRQLHGEPGSAPMSLVVPELPALIVPLHHLFGPAAPPPAEAPPPASLPTGEVALVLRLDAEFIANDLLPRLARRDFPEGSGYAEAVIVPGDPPRTIWRSEPLSFDARHTDLRMPLLNLRPFEELRLLIPGTDVPGLHFKTPTGAGDRGEPGPPFQRIHIGGLISHHFGSRSVEREPGPWMLVVRRRDGSLETAVAALRWRNLGISAGILALLAATSGLMVANAQRAQRLARQQMEFVAAVSHELNTPITAVRSAGQNLADGLVREPEQVRRYGRLLEREGLRLSRMVGQVLEFAGMQSGRHYRLRPEAVAPIVEGALADCRWLLEEKDVHVERFLPQGLPPVLADASSLRGALHNLIENAVKYGGPKVWISLAAKAVDGPSGPEVEISVMDRGAGIDPADLPRLFEPFYRGRKVESNVPGSGLGLSVVRHVAEAHGGGVAVSSPPGLGATFTLRIPVAPVAPVAPGATAPAAGTAAAASATGEQPA